MVNTGCTVLVTSSYRDIINVMSLAWQTPLSIKPPLLGIAVAFPNFTHELISKSKEFALNIPGINLLEQLISCGKLSGREIDKFKAAGLTPVPAKKISVPVIQECLGHIECRVFDSLPTGDHTFFIGEILAAYAEEALFSEHWKEEVELIHHLGGKHYYFSGRQKSI